MTGFFIKKAFFDSWDNLVYLFILNIGYVILLSAGFLVLSAAGLSAWFGIALFIFWICIFIFYSAVVSFAVSEHTGCHKTGFSSFIDAAKKAVIYIPLYSGILFLLVMLVMLAVPFYLQIPGLPGAAALSAVVWGALLIILSLQYYFPMAARQNISPGKALKKAVFLTLDNPVFTVFLMLHSLTILLLSIFTVFLLPGITSVLLSRHTAVKLRMLKYSYLEKYPETRKRDIPWDTLLIEEKAVIGSRNLKNMLFPWKE